MPKCGHDWELRLTCQEQPDARSTSQRSPLQAPQPCEGFSKYTRTQLVSKVSNNAGLLKTECAISAFCRYYRGQFRNHDHERPHPSDRRTVRERIRLSHEGFFAGAACTCAVGMLFKV